jgi:hypothetical protein
VQGAGPQLQVIPQSDNRLERSGYEHRRIHHSQEIYVMGDVHTNTIEGF